MSVIMQAIIILSMWCMQWLVDEFLAYLDSWEASVKGRQGVTDVEKKKMLLSQPTLDGLRMTGIVQSLLFYNNVELIIICLSCSESVCGIGGILVCHPWSESFPK